MLPSLPSWTLPLDVMSAARLVVGVTRVDKLIPSISDGGIIPSAVIQVLYFLAFAYLMQ
jgi:hypothetical protein